MVSIKVMVSLLLVGVLQAVTACTLEKRAIGLPVSPAPLASGWGYDEENGPSHWASSYPGCAGSRQSPVNIALTKVEIARRPHPAWNNYNLIPAKVTLINNGHTVQVKATRANTADGLNPKLVIDSKTYVLDQTHFHWGKTNQKGSEHTINNIRYPLEMHAVHRRVVDGVEVSPPEVIVIAVLFELSFITNTGLAHITRHLEAVKEADAQATITPFAMSEIIHPFKSNFFVYEGSLTTPPCSEVVTFFIKWEHEPITTAQLEKFRVLLNHENQTQSGNFRPVQPLNDRKIRFVIY